MPPCCLLAYPRRLPAASGKTTAAIDRQSAPGSRTARAAAGLAAPGFDMPQERPGRDRAPAAPLPDLRRCPPGGARESRASPGQAERVRRAAPAQGLLATNLGSSDREAAGRAAILRDNR